MEKIYSDICKKIILPIADVATRQRVMRFYRFYEDAQYWGRERLCQYQEARLEETLSIAYNEIPFYRELYDSRNIKIRDINGVSDLTLLPIVTKNMLKASYPNRCTRRTKWTWHEYFTSGSSGSPFAVRVDNKTMSEARALMLLRANFSGWEFGDPFMQTGMTLDRGLIKRLKDFVLRVKYVSAFDLSDKLLDVYLDMIDKKRINYIMGYAGSLYCIACRAIETGFNMTLKGIVSWGDNLYKHYRKKIEHAFRCRVTDTYGCGEGIQIAAQCGQSDGAYHVFMPHVVVEVVDDDGYPVTAGTPGHILLTRLDPGAMPFIRYRVGDIGIKSDKQNCSCGRGLEMLEKIEGRDTDFVLTPNGNRLIVHFFTGIFEYYETINSFKIIQEQLDRITVFIVPRHDFRREHWEKLKSEILEKGDRDLQIDMILVDEIPMEKSNKRRFVVSKVSTA